MNKRHFKKLVQYDITDAIELAILKYQNETNTAIVDGKIDALLALYDDVLAKVHDERQLKDTKAKKKHFKELLADFDKQMETIFTAKG